MDKDEFKTEVKRRYGRTRGHIWAGLFLLGIGALLLLRQMGFYLPDWLFTWQMVLIAIGVFSGLRHGFRGGAWLILILIGGGFLIDDIYPQIDLRRFVWPIVFIAVGLVIILKPRHYHGRRWRHWRKYRERYGNWHQSDQPLSSGEPQNFSKEDYLDVTSVFGGVKKIVVSKNFKGGDITNFMGGTEINLTQSDIQGEVRIDATNIFGGAKIIVPASWDVKSEATAIFGGIEDKRDLHTIKPDPNKVLILEGTCIFGGIEIRNY